jgi:hypothetical protein
MALAMRDPVAQLIGKWRKLGYELDLGIGIAQGCAGAAQRGGCGGSAHAQSCGAA